MIKIKPIVACITYSRCKIAAIFNSRDYIIRIWVRTRENCRCSRNKSRWDSLGSCCNLIHIWPSIDSRAHSGASWCSLSGNSSCSCASGVKCCRGCWGESRWWGSKSSCRRVNCLIVVYWQDSSCWGNIAIAEIINKNIIALTACASLESYRVGITVRRDLTLSVSRHNNQKEDGKWKADHSDSKLNDLYFKINRLISGQILWIFTGFSNIVELHPKINYEKNIVKRGSILPFHQTWISKTILFLDQRYSFENEWE